jgi:hypothetical protein
MKISRLDISHMITGILYSSGGGRNNSLIVLSAWWNTALSLPDHTLSEERIVVLVVILRYPSIVTSYAEPSAKTSRLLLVILSLVVDDVEEAELVDTLGGGDDAEPITELLLLEELLGAGCR